MATVIRAAVSRNNPYWMNVRGALTGVSQCLPDAVIFSATNGISDPTAKSEMAKALYSGQIEMRKRAAIKADEILASYVLKAAAERCRLQL